jgi:cytochrome c-type biogenesis protein CcmH/NrfF
LAAGSGALGTGGGRTTSLYDRVLQVAGEYRCPVCQGETAAASDAPQAVEIKSLIQGWLRAGRSPAQIRSYLVADYGVSILEKPPASGLGALLWALPAVAVGIGAAGLALGFSRWRRLAMSAPSALDATPAVQGTLFDPGPVERGVAPGGANERPVGPVGSRRRFQRATLVGGVALIVLAGALWLVDRASSPRLPGGTVTGSVTGMDAELAQASALATSDPAAALAIYGTVLAGDPEQPQALTGEGWIYSEAGFVAKGVGLLTKAERYDPSYGLAHFYRGVALLDYERRPGAAAVELKWYLSHGPAPTLAADAREALALAVGEAAKARA